MIHVNGVDVSDWQGQVDWDKVKSDGYSFAYAKATQGTSSVQSTFATNCAGIAAAGMLRGAYHMFEFGSDPATQAQNFLKTAAPQAGDLPPMIDLELSTNSSPRDAITAVRSFLSIVEAQINAKCVIYLGFYFWRDALGGTDAFSSNPLWLANYTTAEQPSAMPAVWSKLIFWQYSSNGNLAGINGAVDLDRYIGSLSDLRQLTLK
jgi:lysozyme